MRTTILCGVILVLSIPAAADAEPKTGMLWVDSNPPNARIRIDGKERTERAGETLWGVPVGVRRVQVYLSDYQVWEGRVEVVAQELKTVEAALKPNWGRMVVNTVPSDAMVSVGDPPVEVGRSPYSNDRQAAGRVRVTARHEWYRPKAMELEVVAGKGGEVTLRLEEDWGHVEVHAHDGAGNAVADAAVFVDREELGRTDAQGRWTSGRLRLSSKEASGRGARLWLVHVKAPSYVGRPVEVGLRPGATRKVELRLRPMVGRVQVDSNVRGARVFVDGVEQKGKVAPCWLSDVLEGEREIRLERSGFVPGSTQITVVAGEDAPRVKIELEPLADAQGRSATIAKLAAGVTVAALGGVVFSFAKADQAKAAAATALLDYRQSGIPEDAATHRAGVKEAQERQTAWATAGWGSAGLAVGAGAVLVYTLASMPEQSSVRLTPGGVVWGTSW